MKYIGITLYKAQNWIRMDLMRHQGLMFFERRGDGKISYQQDVDIAWDMAKMPSLCKNEYHNSTTGKKYYRHNFLSYIASCIPKVCSFKVSNKGYWANDNDNELIGYLYAIPVSDAQYKAMHKDIDQCNNEYNSFDQLSLYGDNCLSFTRAKVHKHLNIRPLTNWVIPEHIKHMVEIPKHLDAAGHGRHKIVNINYLDRKHYKELMSSWTTEEKLGFASLTSHDLLPRLFRDIEQIFQNSTKPGIDLLVYKDRYLELQKETNVENQEYLHLVNNLIAECRKINFYKDSIESLASIKLAIGLVDDFFNMMICYDPHLSQDIQLTTEAPILISDLNPLEHIHGYESMSTVDHHWDESL